MKENSLTGIEFVWLPDTGKFRAASQWYIPIAYLPLGRGLDHPWFDPKKLSGSDGWQPKSRRFRTGVYHFDVRQIKSNANLSPLHKRLFSLFEPDVYALTIIAFRSYLRSSLPKTDFAFNWRQKDEKMSGFVSRQRGLCVNRETRDILLREKLVSPQDFEAIQVVDRTPRGVERLDTRGLLPEPLLTSHEIASWQPKLDSLWQKHIAKEKPVRSITMKEALSLLRAAKRERPDDFKKGTTLAALAKLKLRLPSNWMALLAVANGGLLDPDGECEIVPAAELPALIAEKRKLIESLDDEYPFQCQHIPCGASARRRLVFPRGKEATWRRQQSVCAYLTTTIKSNASGRVFLPSSAAMHWQTA